MKKRGESNKARWIRYAQFLSAHPELLNGSPQAAVAAMKEAGVIAPTTYWQDCASVRKLLRGQETEGVARCSREEALSAWLRAMQRP